MSTNRRPFPRTSAPRSSVVHGLAIDVADHVTLCGRRIGDEWAGEYTDMPHGPIDCKRCLTHLDSDVAVSVADWEAAQSAELLATAKHAVGDRVGIWTGLLSVGGKWIGSFGRVTAVNEFWTGSLSYSVRADGESESFIYEGYLLATADEAAADMDRRDAERTERNRRADADARAAAVTPADVTAELDRANPWNVQPMAIADFAATRADDVRSQIRAAAMERHPAGKGRKSAAMEIGTRVEIVSPGMRDNGRIGTIVATHDDDTVSVRVIGEQMSWAWHRSHVMPIRDLSSYALPALRQPSIRLQSARVIAGEFMADRTTGDSVRVLARTYPRIVTL